MSSGVLTLPEARSWLEVLASVLLADSNDRDRFAWVAEAQHALPHPRARRAVARDNTDAAHENMRFGTRESRRDARILSLIATILRAVEGRR